MPRNKYKEATTGELVTELVVQTVKAVKETNTTRGLTKKTGKELDSIISELVGRKILTEEQAEKIKK
jgi:hypothetical protein